MNAQWKKLFACFALAALCTACTGGIEFGSSDTSATDASPSTVVKFTCQSPVQVSNSGNFSAVGCASAGATGPESSSSSAISSDSLQALGEALLGD